MYPKQTGPEISFVVQWLPALLVFLVLALVVMKLAERKGQDKTLCVLAMLVPVLNVLTLVWLVSLTDRAVLAELAELRARLDGMAPPGP